MDVEACSLSGDDLRERLAELRTVLLQARSGERLGDVAVFRFDRRDERSLRALIDQEAECCGFWRFGITTSGSDVVLEVGVRAPRFNHFVDRFCDLADA